MLNDDLCCLLPEGDAKVADYPYEIIDNNYGAIPDGLKDLGEIVSINFGAQSESVSVPSSKNRTETACEIDLTSERTIDLEVRCLSKNIAAAILGGEIFEGTVDTVVGEKHKVFSTDDVISLNNLANDSETITVTNEAGDTTYAVGVDYELERRQIKILATGSIAVDSIIKVDYTSLKSRKIVTTGKSYVEKAFVFEGSNRGQDGKPIRLLLRRVKFKPAESFGFLDVNSNDPVTITIQGKILADKRILADEDTRIMHLEFGA